MKALLYTYLLVAWYWISYLLVRFGGLYLLRRIIGPGRWIREFHRFMNLLLPGLVLFTARQLWNVDTYLAPLRNAYLIHLDEIRISYYSLFAAVYTLLVSWWAIRLLREIVYFWLWRRGQAVVAGSWRSLISNLGFLLVVILFLLELGITWKVILPFAGALGIGLGFGLQTIFNNYISGFILMISRNLKVGDIIELEGNAGMAIGNTSRIIYGRVTDINILTTRIRTVDGVEIAVPNSSFVSDKIINYTLQDDLVRMRIPFGVAYSSDPEQVRQILLQVAEQLPHIQHQPPPEVQFVEMADSALIFHLLITINVRDMWRLMQIRSDAYFKGWQALKAAGIEIPFPQRDLWFRNPMKVELLSTPSAKEK